MDRMDVELYLHCQIFSAGERVPAGFFSSSKGLRQGDPLSPYLFIMGMEVLSVLITKAVEGGFIHGCRIWRGREQAVNMNSSSVCGRHNWEVEGVLEMAAEIGCRVGQLPTIYLGLPLGAPNRASSVWDGVEERMRRRLALWKRQFYPKEGELLYKDQWGNKVHLVRWEVVCADKEKGGLGLRKITLLNKALLGKWIWRFTRAKEELWKKVLEAKYGKEELGWRTRKANGAFGVGVWKEILKESTWCWENMGFKVGKGNRIRFWTDLWCGNNVLSQGFPNLFSMVVHRMSQWRSLGSECGSRRVELKLLRDLNDWELGLVGNLLVELRDYSVNLEDDSVFWKKGEDVLFKVKKAYNVLVNSQGWIFLIAMFGWTKSQPKLPFLLGSYLGEGPHFG
ncbi:putative ribonuclease H protein [Vitis vinifera]|uniref:Putative ribonuclease H protein n=1 Tax=Vitis vinifera TaxID=29760 RepID=A0A438K5M1_VITVI|nr:putative ribonuclease H protein [Vitis vinifera]